MSSNDNLVDESVDDGIPANFLNEFFDGMDNPVLQVDGTQARTALIVQERLKKFNEAWNIAPSVPEMPSTSTARASEPQPGPSSTTGSEIKQPVPSTSTEQPQAQTPAAQQSPLTPADGLLGSPSSLQIVEDTPNPSTSRDGARGRAVANNGRRSRRRRRSDTEDEEDEADDYDNRSRRAGRSQRRRSRSPTQRPSRRVRSRTPPRSRSRFTSRSPRRRRSRQRSRSPPRSRSLSRDSRSSSDRERRRRHSSRRHRHNDHPPVAAVAPNDPTVQNVTAMAQSMMSMMQMFTQYASAMNHMQPTPAVPIANPLQAGVSGLVPPVSVAHPIVPAPTLPTESPVPSAADTSTPMQPQPTATTNGAEDEPQYDGTTELFLEGRMNFGQYLRKKPLCMVQPRVNPKVCERVKEAIAVLERQELKEQTAKFMYVSPYYYGETRKKENRSPLIWNDQNVLFGLTSNSREVKHCEPFANVNAKLKGLIGRLGLDEGAISQELQRNALASVNGVPTDSGGDAGSSSRIQAISTLPLKPGTARVRHVIERAVQTEGYACGECLQRAKKTFVAGGTQTTFAVPRQTDAAVQVTPAGQHDQNPFVPVIALDNLTSSQIETIDAIVRFIRTRHVTGPVDAVQHALNKDSTARSTMGPALFETARTVLSTMTDDPRSMASSYASSSSNSGHRYVVSIQQHVQQPDRAAPSGTIHSQVPAPKPKPSGGRYFQAFNNQSAIQPACYAPPAQLSKKAKKKLNKRQDASWQ